LVHWMRAAASRTFWTAGRSRPMSTAMMAMTTSSSIRVNALRPRARNKSLRMATPSLGEEDNAVGDQHRTSRAPRIRGAGRPPSGSSPDRRRARGATPATTLPGAAPGHQGGPPRRDPPPADGACAALLEATAGGSREAAEQQGALLLDLAPGVVLSTP